MNKLVIDSNIQKKINTTLSNKAKFVYLFGSALTPYFNENSDLDIGVYLGRKLDFREKLQFISDLEDRLNLPYEIDLVLLDSADPIIAMQILANGKRIYCSDSLIHLNYKIRMLSIYLDFKKDRKIIEDAIGKGSIYA